MSLKNILNVLDILDGSVISIPYDLNISGSELGFFLLITLFKICQVFLLSEQFLS